jgi:hypothetical protein
MLEALRKVPSSYLFRRLMGMYQDSDDRTDHWCVFSREIQNHDAGSALIMYENGIHASYSQNFLSRRAAYRRGAMVVGLVKGRAGPIASLRDGLLSAAMCLAARESARTKTFQPL